MKTADKLIVSAGVGVIGFISVLVLTMLAGWISNIVQVVHMAQADNICAMFWIKLVGCCVAPIGSILGITGWF